MVHSATMSDVHLDLLDWNVHNLQPVPVANNPPPPIVHSSSDNNDNLTSLEDNNHVVNVVDHPSSLEEDSAPVQNSYSMFTIISTPKIKGIWWRYFYFLVNNPTLT